VRTRGRRGQRSQVPVDPSAGRREYVNAAWQGNDVVLMRREPGGRFVKERSRAEHACFLRVGDVSAELDQALRQSRHVVGVLREGDWVRIRWSTRDACRQACGPDGWFEREGISTFEADVNPIRRILTDRDLAIQRPRRAYVDLETDSRVPPRRAAQGLARVLCWALVGEDGFERSGMLKTDSDRDEQVLLEHLWDVLLDFDQVAAWNGDRFDFPILWTRSSMHRVEVDPRRWLWVDHLECFRTFNISASESGDEKQSMALGRVAESLGLAGKLDLNASETFERWEEGGESRRRLGEYNLNDSRLMKQIEDKTGYLELLYTVANVCGVFPDSRAISSTQFVEGFLLRLGLRRGVHFRSRWGSEVAAPVAGAYVMEPTRRGIVRNVHVADFSGMYPSIIQTWNLSPETHRSDVVLRENDLTRPSYLMHVPLKEYPRPSNVCEVPIVGHAFDASPLGILPEAIDALRAMRQESSDRKARLPPGTDEWKAADRLSSGAKIAGNSFFGVTACTWSRFYHREVAESVTQAGVWLITETIKAAEARGLSAIGGDTDSLFVVGGTEAEFAEFVSWCNAELYPKIVAELGCVRNEIRLAYEKQFERVVVVAKKRYAGRYSHYKGARANERSKPEIKGLEYKRGDTARLARRLQAKAIDLLLGGGVVSPRREHCEEDPEVFVDLVRQWRWLILEGPLERRDYVLAKRLSKPLRHYRRKVKKDGTAAALPPHVEVGLVLREAGHDVDEGTLVEYVVVDGAASPMRVVPAIQHETGQEDRFYLWEAMVYPATQRLLEAAFPGGRWREFAKARPPKRAVVKSKVRDSRPAARGRRRVLPGQGSLF
jgi:DNA polymerase elongation subunit (family B)